MQENKVYVLVAGFEEQLGCVQAESELDFVNQITLTFKTYADAQAYAENPHNCVASNYVVVGVLV